MASTFKIAVDKMGATDPYNYVGRKGDIFYDPEFGELRISDGDTPYGAGLQAGIGASTPSIDQVLTVSNVAALEAKFAGGIRFESVESLEGLNPITFDADVVIDVARTITATNTNFDTLNGLTIPAGPGTIALLSNIAGSGTVLESLDQDQTPELGGDLNTASFVIENTSAPSSGITIRQTGTDNPGLIVIKPDNSEVFKTVGDVITLKDNQWPTTDGEVRQTLITDGSGQLSWDYRNPYTRFYYYYGGTSPIGAVQNSNTLGVGIGTWEEVTFANATGSGNIGNYAPPSAVYDPKLTNITVSNGVFSGFENGGVYRVQIDIDILNSTANLALQTHKIICSDGGEIKGTVVYPGQSADNSGDPIVQSLNGVFTFNTSSSTLTVQLQSEQSIGYYITEAMITIMRIS